MGKLSRKEEILARAEVVSGILQGESLEHFLVGLSEHHIAFAVSTRRMSINAVLEKVFMQWDDVDQVLWEISNGGRTVLEVNFAVTEYKLRE